MARTPVPWPPKALQSDYDAPAAEQGEGGPVAPPGALTWPEPDRHPRHIVATLTWAQDGTCYLCGKPWAVPTRDHVVPKAKGGKSRWNQLLAHPRCNVRKSDRWPYPCELMLLHAVNMRCAEGPGRKGLKRRDRRVAQARRDRGG